MITTASHQDLGWRHLRIQHPIQGSGRFGTDKKAHTIVDAAPAKTVVTAPRSNQTWAKATDRSRAWRWAYARRR